MAGFSNQAWVTSVLSDDDIPDALTLCFSLKRQLTSRKVVVIVSDKISPSNRKALVYAFDQCVSLDADCNKAGLKIHDFAKLYTLTLKLYELCVYLSPTIIAVKNCDEIFEEYNSLPDFVCSSNDRMTWFVAQPSLETFEVLMKSLCERNEQAGLWTWIKNKTDPSKLLDAKYSCTLPMKYDQGTIIETKAMFDLAEFAFEVDTNKIGLLHGVVLNARKIIYEESVLPLLKSVNLEHISYLSLSSTSGKILAYDKESIAIVGMSCRFPGANNLEEYWNILINGEDATGTPPDFRWLPNQTIKHGDHFRKTNAGFLRCPVDSFDSNFFGISPLEAGFMDPQQRLLHEVVWEGLEDAALNPQCLKGLRGGVFVGSWKNDFNDMLTQAGTRTTDEYRVYMGNAIGNTAGRLSFMLGLTGPCMGTDSSCSSAMLSIHTACKSLRNGESQFALACGVNLILEPFDKTWMPAATSDDGHCKTFDANADGFGRAEGVGVLVLKRLSDAVKDGDRIWALIRGTGVSQEGISKSLGTPTVHCEAQAMKEALADAGITDPSSVSYVEAHGTGTQVGDPIEIQAITEAYKSTTRKEPLLVGSVKTNLGHTESCSGIAGIMKVVLAMKHGVIPKHRNFETLNPAIDLDILPAKIPLENTSWEKVKGKLRIAGVNSFGITGTDAHVILEEPPFFSNDLALKLNYKRPLHILKISVKTEEALEILLEKFRNHLSTTDSTLQDIAHTANVGRADFNQRVIIIAESKEDAVKIIEQKTFQKGEEVPNNLSRKVCFLFTGQGSQYPGMARQLYDTSPVFRMHFEYCENILKEKYGINISHALWSTSLDISRTIYSQTSIFCVEYALLMLLASWGIKADYVLGHSLGEFAAAVCAGILSVDDAIKLVAERSILIDQLPQGKMLVVKADQQKVDTLLKEFAGNDQRKLLDYAAINSNDQTVVAGDSEVVLAFSEFCKQSKLKYIVLQATHAFHSKHMDPILEVYRGDCSTIKPCQKSKCGFISAVRGSLVSPSDINEDYWVQHTREKVNFLNASKKAVELGCTTFIEIGPQPVLAALTSLNNDEQLICLPTLKKSEDNWETMLNTLGKLYVRGTHINWKGLDYLYNRKIVSLPHYPFIGKKYWPEMSISTGVSLHPLLGSVISNASSAKIFENELTLSTPHLDYLKDHCLGDNIIFPGAGYLETFLAAGLAALENCNELLPRPTRPMKVENLTIESPLLLQISGTCRLQSVVEFNSTPRNNNAITGDWNEMKIKLFQHIVSESKWQVRATALFCPLLNSNDREWIFDKNIFFETLQKPSEDDTVGDFYRKFAAAGLKFGPSFKLIEKVWPDKSKFTVLAKLKVPHVNCNNRYTVHPAILDAMLQGICMLYPISNWKRMFYVPIKIGKFVWFSDSDCMETYIYAYQSSPATSDATALLVDGNGQILAAMSSVELIETSLKAIEAVIDQQQSPVPDLWEEIWKKRPSSCEQFTDMQKVAKIFDNGEINQIEAFNKLPPDVGQIFKNLEKLAYLNYLRALYELGWKPQLHQRFSETTLFEELRILQEFRQYFSFFCTFLEAEGILRRMEAKGNKHDTVWEILQNPPTPEKILVLLNSPQLNDQLVQKFATTALLQKLGSSLAHFFMGLQSPISVLFPNEKTGRMSIGDFYKESMQVFNIAEPYKRITQVVLNHIRDSQQGNPYKIRILEVGSGTGTYSQISIDLLEAEGIQFEYTFTDISNAFFNSAEKKFETHIKSMIFKKFNIEEDPVAQGFIPEYFDVVLACNVIHATRNIAESLQNIQIVMKPSARLILFETLCENHLATFTVGVLDSYWRFQDFELRKTHCTLGKDTWTQVLEANGLEVEGNFSLCNDKDAIIVSRNTVGKPKREACKTWLIFHHPNHPVSEQLKIKIGNVPGRCVFTVMTGKKYGIDFVNKQAILRREFYVDFVALLENLKCQQVEIEGILYCWALDNDNTDQEQLLQPYFNLTKAALVQRSETTPRFAVITNGVVYLGDNELPGFHSSTLWGYTKTMKIENFEVTFKCLDIADGRLDATRIQEIFYEIWKTDNEVQVAFSGNSRFVPKLVPCRISHSALKLPSGTDRFQLTMPKTKAITDLQFVTLEKFDLKDNEVELQVKVSALIFKDLLSVIKPSMQFDSSNAIGGDFAGVIVRVGSEVKKWKAGDKIFGYNNNNMALPSHIKMSPNHLIPIPDHWSFSDAATIPSVYVTAFMCLYESAKIKRDDVILIHTATGGVGLSAIAVCKHVGCQIIATAGSKRKQNYLRNLGIQHIFNSRSIKFSDEILAVTNGRGVDVVINTLTSDGFKEATLRACAKNARFVELSKLNTWTPTEVKNLRDDVHYEILDLSIATDNDWTRYCTVLQTLTKKNVVKPLPFVKFDGVDICQALEYMQSAKHIGKIVCTMPEVGIDGGEIQISTPMFTHEGSYLITGGCGGIGSEVCQWMIERGAKHILLASRSPPAANIQNKMSKMNMEGANVIPVQLDIGQYGECEKLLQTQIPNLGLPPLRGIMHAAGIIADDLIANMNWKKLASVFDSKICGTINLHELTKDMNLEFFVIFSSFTSLSGNAFQCNYTAANAFEDAFTNYRHSIGLPAMTINWGLWGETGLAKRNEIPGLKPLSNLQGLRGLEYAMKMQRIQTCIPKIDSLVVLNKFFPSVSTYLDERVWKSSVSTGTTASKPANFLQCYNSATDNEMKFMFVQQQLRLVIQNTLRINNADIIENDTNLQDMGMDSLLFIQLRNAISILVGDQMIINAGMVRNVETINMLTSMLIKLIEEHNDKSNADEFVEEEKVPLDIKKEASILPQSHDQSVLSHTIQKPSGKPAAPPLLIASGMLGVKSQWDSIAKKIADGTSRNVIAFDARCHGESPNLGELSYESMADDIIKLTQFLKIDMFSYLGTRLVARQP